MKSCENVYQIKVDFNVTPQVKPYVYVYSITEKECYLIDAGVVGCEKAIADYMEKVNRSRSEIKAIFLTQAHPGHIGAEAKLKEASGCSHICFEIRKRMD